MFPKLFCHGSRSLQVEWSAPSGAAMPVVESLEGVVVHTSSPAAGECACSFFFSSRRRHTRFDDWSSDVCSSDLVRSRQGQLLIHETSPVLATPILFGDVGALSFSSCSPARLSGRTSETNPP